ncbi:meso-butanediol dehydrogenase / (S,S)-butanediol dehydrogenase / diacetyl reductase [Variovorax sp. HW608]|uniref:SDR family NAD(P)-dependent oxidoreductase n=1 Tax=Variovorax sp. HW608 TaxID=1034889 RepID=UPI00081F8E6C|nr:SDR family NAD(P)-dependent oxidoreductase [Variovorax sp. HW608]SCK42846.1 meso-butanediol dehydrogenase / (S,S)-butanediol dehydrogenase / diacetyl reductase [Variovorax sp. HW608]
MKTLDNAVVVVTGGAAGIGRALAIEAAARGAAVLIGDVQDAQPTVDAITISGGRAEWRRCDMTQYSDVANLAAYVVKRFGGVNVLCNNAGRGVPGALHATDPAMARQVLDLNVLGLFHGIHAFTSQLQAAASAGRPAFILNTGSEHSLGVPPHVGPMSVYTASKFAALGLTETAARDLAPLGIKVSLLTPGWVRTERVAALIGSSVEAAARIEPYAQDSAEVAAKAFDGLAAGHLIIATNPASREFAMAHARQLMAEVQRLPLLAGHPEHENTATETKGRCPFMHGNP